MNVDMMTPVITDQGMREVRIHFDSPIPPSMYPDVLKRIMNSVNQEHEHKPQVSTSLQIAHVHSFSDTPIFDDGEEIAVLRQCACGVSIRESV